MTSTTSNIQFGDAVSSVQANNINGDVHIGRHENTLDRLPCAEDAPFNSYARQHEHGCLSDTRVDLLQEIHSWADGQDERCIFWLSGLAGTGKSTVARTVAHSYYTNQRLAASFFFSRGGGDVSHAGMFVTSIAVQLADNVPASRCHIRDAIAERSGIARQSFRDQWHHLILYPLSKLREATSYILVVDALDECDKRQQYPNHQVPIRHGFGQMADSKHKDVVLHRLSPLVVDHDIGIFLEHWLRIIAKDCYYEDGWPGAETIKQLVQSVCGLFIWAATAFRFIQEGGQFAKNRLRIVLKDSAVTDNSSEDSTSSEDSGTYNQREILPEKQLDSIYLTVLKRPVRQYTKYERKKWYTLMKEILGAIVLLYSPLSATSLSRLLLRSIEEVYRTLHELHSILDVPQHSTYHIRLHHPSFRDFLLNKDRCRDTNLWHYLHWLEALSWMGKVSKGIFAISSLESIALDGDCPDLYAFIHDMKRFALYSRLPIELAPLQVYSSALVDNEWSAYLQTLEGHDNSIFSLVFSRDSTRLASVSNYKKAKIWDVRSGKCLQTFRVYNDLVAFSHDLTRLASVLQDNTIMIWDTSSGACLHTLGGHGNVSSIAFSHDSMQLASASRDGTIEIWDASSCVCLHRSEIYNNDFIVKAFSHDLMHLALVSNSTSVIKVWDASSGTCLQTLNSDCKYVFSIAFSQNFAWLASALRSNTVKIWDISSVAFSHNSMRLASASASDDRVIKIWDTSNGACLQTYKGHSRAIKSVAFSYNSMQIASASRDKTIKIWDTSGSACLWKHEDHKDNMREI
ncbi:hypothetical protein COCSADRAFT_178355 [Bipolaris sorokiniana ND90Pr]|uniref:Nephrocystin 3-like N-terminal domain-containing protein n=1 Tax=Cochliobolus sativus (strain ND90Pr / ATCC 201652) TaxID=665912 RepID=M2T234_COCSN|nr:uncharacterized protein COCSADRAFT_178355 [Bipolaris sorokiniana ND90Pr]EMD68550.1 hypothetical protein COCSADRAFT_178355 [Bipolaris sorokiniana ND90Pr]